MTKWQDRLTGQTLHTRGKSLEVQAIGHLIIHLSSAKLVTLRILTSTTATVLCSFWITNQQAQSTQHRKDQAVLNNWEQVEMDHWLQSGCQRDNWLLETIQPCHKVWTRGKCLIHRPRLREIARSPVVSHLWLVINEATRIESNS